MRLLLGLMFGLALGGLAALVIASQMAAAQHDHLEIAGDDAATPSLAPAV